jgi:hypothetical protein
MYDYIQYAYRYYGKNHDNKPNDKPKVATPVLTQEQIQDQLRNPIERKPASYKSINASSVNLNQK